MGNIFTKTGRAPKAALLLFIALFLGVSLLSIFRAPNASAIPVGLPIPGSATGQFLYVAPDHSTQTFRSNAKVTLTGTSGNIGVSVNDNGKFNAKNIPSGTYTLGGSYTINNQANTHGDQVGTTYILPANKYTITTGKTTTIIVTVGTSSTGTTTGTVSSCAKTDSNGNCTSANSSDDFDCGSGKFNWLVCPFIDLAMHGANTIDSFIMNSLDVDVGPIFDQTTQKGSASNGYYTAWNSFRILATVLLIVGGLVMVASQALGFEFLDAYTVRKTLPRLLVAVIGISLSWPLMRLAVSFFDTAGFDIRELMYAPFKNLGGGLSITAGALSTLGVGAAFFAIGPTSLTFILTALLAVFVGFIIVVIRQVAIIMLVILAPIAIACYILPNTQKVWKLWRENFLGLLLMFPIISALIAAGHIFSAVALKGNGSNNSNALLTQAIGVVAYFIPYFLLPLAARLATGIIGNIAGIINDRHRGAFDMLKNVRKGGLDKRKAHYGGKARAAMTQTKAGALRRITARADAASSRGSMAGKVGGAALRFAGRRIEGIESVERQVAALNAEKAKILSDQTSSGRDSEFRGASVNLKAADADAMNSYADADGYTYSENGLRRTKNGVTSYRTLGGGWVGRSDAINGLKRHGKDRSMTQAVLSYEMRKALTAKDAQGIADRYDDLATNVWGMTEDQANDAWIGPAFENQNRRLEFKNMSRKGELKGGGSTLTNETYDKLGSYGISQMGANTVDLLGVSYDNAVQRRQTAMTEIQKIDSDIARAATPEEREQHQNARNTQMAVMAEADEVMQKSRGIAETFMHSYGGGRGQQVADGEGQAKTAGELGAGDEADMYSRGGVRQSSASGSAALNEAVRRFAEKTGMYDSDADLRNKQK